MAENRKKWHLMPTDSDVATLEIIREVLGPLSSFTDALSGEKTSTLSSVLPLKWKLFSCLTVKDGESTLSRDMKDNIKADLTRRYECRILDTALNIVTFIDPRFKDTFVTTEEEVKAVLLQKSDDAPRQPQKGQEQPEHQEGAKKRKTGLKSLLSTIKSEKMLESGEASGAKGGGKSFHIPC